MKRVAITGGVSCGKSSVSRYFKELGAYVVDADEIVHQLLDTSTEVGKKIIKLIGPGIVVGEKIDRSLVAKKVFFHPTLLKSLEKILHPLVFDEIERQFREVIEKKDNITLFLAQVPLFFESENSGKKKFDYTIAVVADQETCWERYRESTGHEREEFNLRTARQLSQHEKAEKADFVIYNNGNLDELREEVIKVNQKICGN